MRFLNLSLFCLFLTACANTPAIKSKTDASPPYEMAAQRVIDKCWTISEKDRNSGVTSRIRNGTQESSKCMEQHILEIARTTLYPKSPELVEATQKDLKNISTYYSGLYWNLYNRMSVCSPYCGTMHHARSDGSYVSLLSDIIKDIYLEIALKASYQVD